MRRLARWTLNALTVLSLLLCVATVIAWVRSYRHHMEVSWAAGQMPEDGRARWEHDRWLSVNRGVVGAASTYQQWPGFGFWSGPDAGSQPLHYWEDDVYSDDWLDDLHYRYDGNPAFHSMRWAGFRLTYPRMTTVAAAKRDPVGDVRLPYVLVAPAWAIASLLALLPAIRLVGWWRKGRRFRAGLCSSCSYDLTGNTSGVCPECGTTIPQPKPSTLA